MVAIGHDADGSLAGAEDHTGFTRGHSDDGVFTFAGHELCVGTGTTGDLGTLARTHLNVVDDGTEGDFANRKAVAQVGGHACAAEDFLAHLDTMRSHDVAFLTVCVINEGDSGRTVRIVFNRLHDSGNAIFLSFKINHTVHLFVTASAVPYRHFTTVVSSACPVFRTQQTLFGCVGGNVIKCADHFEALTRRYWFVLFKCHLF